MAVSESPLEAAQPAELWACADRSCALVGRPTIEVSCPECGAANHRVPWHTT